MNNDSLIHGWKRTNLLSLAEYHNGAAFNPSHWGDEGLPIIRIEQINDPTAPTDFYEGPLAPQNLVTTGDLIFSWSATLKVVIWKNGDGALNQHLFKVVPKKGTDKLFLKYVLEHNMERISAGSQGSTMKHITRRELKRYHVEVPKMEVEQCRIAEILSALDAEVDQTEALLSKYQQIKAGLMHDLFTRGVLANGCLRPSRDENPHLYKETPIGWIPEEWRYERLGKFAEIVSGVTLGGRDEASYELSVPYLRVANVQDGYFELTDVKTIPVSRSEFDKLQLRIGDVLMNEGGDFDKLGRGSVWNEEIKPCIHQNHVFRVRPIGTDIRSYFLAFWSESEFGKKYFVLSSKQSTNLASINSTQLNRFPIAIPCYEEQGAIEERITSIKNRINSLLDKVAKLRMTKRGLMQDLLNGYVSVTQE